MIMLCGTSLGGIRKIIALVRETAVEDQQSIERIIRTDSDRVSRDKIVGQSRKNSLLKYADNCQSLQQAD